jgi:EmrB/QacA subfamily drug resistance transporter
MTDHLKGRNYIIGAALLALFLGALDTLIMSAAMPTIVTDLGGLHFYSWVFSTYMLARAVSLPIFGKLADLFSSKILFLISIALFSASSIWAGLSDTMLQLILSRTLQGLGAGGIFALVYIVLSDISVPAKRGKMMPLASFVWGVASVLGPSLGGFIVTYFSWRWIFFINLPLGMLSLAGIYLYFSETRSKRKEASVDVLGIFLLSVTVLALLTGFLLLGQGNRWFSFKILGLFALTAFAGALFYHVEKRAKEPVLPIQFFSAPGFRMGNGAVFFCSFAIFTLVAYIPIFIQGALGKSPAQLGLAMVALSVAWSLGALVCGQMAHRIDHKHSGLMGAMFLSVGSGISLCFSSETSLWICYIALTLVGLGMGYVSIATLLIVQNSLDEKDLGVATASHQFSRTLAGTVGIGIAGSLVTGRLADSMDGLMGSKVIKDVPVDLFEKLRQNMETFFQPDIQSLLSPETYRFFQKMIGDSVMVVFYISFIASLVCFVFCCRLPRGK